MFRHGLGLPVVVLFTLVHGAFAQELRRLEISGKTPIQNQYASLISGEVRCDGDDTVYFIPGANSTLDTLVGITADGKQTTRFSLAAIQPVNERRILSDFAVGDEEVHLVVGTPSGTKIATFAKDGRFKRIVALDLDHVAVQQFAAVYPGRFFVAGTATNGALQRSAFSAMFSDRGQLLAPVSIAEGRTETQEHSTTLGNLGIPANEALIALSIAATGPDRTIYLARPDPAGPIFVISPSGELKRTIHLSPPKGADKLTGLKISSGRMAVVFEGEPPTGGTAPVWISILDPESGKTLALYFHQDVAIGDSLACYSSTPMDSFTFLGADDMGKLYFARATPK